MLPRSHIFKENVILKLNFTTILDSSTLKKVGVIAGTTAVLGIVAVLSTTMLSFGKFLRRAYYILLHPMK